MARQLGWGLAGLPYPAETWPVLGAPAVWVMRGEGGGSHHSAPARDWGWDPGQAGVWSGSTSRNGGPAGRVQCQVQG